jgi:preprotein translocase subunit SecD
MLVRFNGFNLYLALAILVASMVGCATPANEEKKVLSTLRLHLQARPEPMAHTEVVEVYRVSPVKFSIDEIPFLTEAMVKEAKVIDAEGGFALQIQFDQKGTWLLEEYTSANRTKHIVVVSQFVEPGEKELNKGRPLAAPRINNHITNGLFIFSPDASREEAERIALGLNHVAEKLETGKDIKM